MVSVLWGVLVEADEAALVGMEIRQFDIPPPVSWKGGYLLWYIVRGGFPSGWYVFGPARLFLPLMLPHAPLSY